MDIAKTDLHSTMVRLKAAQACYQRIDIRYLHSTMVRLKGAGRVYHAAGSGFTFHYGQIKRTLSARDRF